MVSADEDEECDLCNLAAGVAVAVCEEFAACRAFMFFGAMIFIFVSLVTCLCGGPEGREDIWDSMPSRRRVAGGVGGYLAARALIRRR